MLSLLLLPVAGLLLAIGLVLHIRIRGEAAGVMKLFACVCVGGCSGAIVLIYMGAIYAGVWPGVIGALAAIIAYVPLRGRQAGVQ